MGHHPDSSRANSIYILCYIGLLLVSFCICFWLFRACPSACGLWFQRQYIYWALNGTIFLDWFQIASKMRKELPELKLYRLTHTHTHTYIYIYIFIDDDIHSEMEGNAWFYNLPGLVRSCFRSPIFLHVHFMIENKIILHIQNNWIIWYFSID